MDRTHRQLLDAVLAEPADDAPRLVPADWFCERADPRGEFIAIQCQIARLVHLDPRIDSTVDPLQAREHAILVVHGKRWLDAGGLDDSEATFARGFVDSVRMTYDRLVEVQDRFSRLEPVCRLAVKRVRDKDVDQILARPWTARLTGLSFNNNGLGTAAAKALLGAPRPPRLSHLNLWGNRIGDDGVVALASSAYFSGLTRLDLGCTRMGSQGAIALANCPHLSVLEQLELEGNPIGDAGALALVQSPHLAKLTRLNVDTLGIASSTIVKLKQRFAGVLAQDPDRVLVDLSRRSKRAENGCCYVERGA